ncbi:class A beta-lactamase [Microvirga subterranea]|nr:class A beta-lactamase [Microvirga subterranea]
MPSGTKISITRRTALAGSFLAIPALAGRAAAQDPKARLADLERRHGGRLGVAILDTQTGRRIEHRAGERFAMCSTFKAVAAALVLARVDRGEERLDRHMTFTKADLVRWSPVTEKHVGTGMTMAQICEAAITSSDNTAGNLMLESFGGPAALTAYARTLGDSMTRLDRIETALNEATPGDPRDTTTPAAMLGTMEKLLLGEALSGPSREQLTAWLVANKTGDRRIRAALPRDWRVGDKTGTGDNGAANDIAILWPPGRGSILIAAYYAEAKATDEQRNAVLADVGRVAATL